jgi:predicted RNase H-like HicB family nuclease
MQYPLYVHRDGGSGFRATFPDFPRADSRGATFEELKHNAQAAVESMYDGSEHLIPAPTNSTSELRALDVDDGMGIWMFIDINLARVTSKAVGIELSLLENLLQRVDAAAKERHITRSTFITLAAEHELEQR